MTYEIGPQKIHVPEVVAMLNLHGPALRLLLVMLRFANKSMVAFPGRETILRYMPDMDVRRLSRAFKELISDGYIERRFVFDEVTGGQKKNAYTILLPSVKKIRVLLRRDTSAGGGDKNGPPGVSKMVPLIGGTLKTKNLKNRRTAKSPPVRSLDRSRSKSRTSSNEAADRVLDDFKRLYEETTGNSMVEFPKHRWIMEGVVSAIGEAAAGAVVEMWFKNGPWSAWAKQVGYKLAGGMERSIEQIQDSDGYQQLKRDLSRKLADI